MDITQLSDKAIAQFRNQKMGFIFQFHELLPEFTALENVCLPTWLGGESQKDAVPKAMELLERLGVGKSRFAQTCRAIWRRATARCCGPSTDQ